MWCFILTKYICTIIHCTTRYQTTFVMVDISHEILILIFPTTAHRRPAEEISSASVWGEQTERMGGVSETPAASQQQTCESHIRQQSNYCICVETTTFVLQLQQLLPNPRLHHSHSRVYQNILCSIWLVFFWVMILHHVCSYTFFCISLSLFWHL